MLVSTDDIDANNIEYLLANKADPSIRDKRGYHSLHYAAAKGNSEGLIRLFEYDGQSR